MVIILYPIQIYDPMTRIGVPYALVDPKKVIGVVEINISNYLQVAKLCANLRCCLIG